MLSFENNAHPRSHKGCFLLTVEIRDYNVMTDGRTFFDQPVKNRENNKNEITFARLQMIMEMIIQLVVC